MRHRKRGRRLGRSSSHRKAMLKNLASSLFLTEIDDLFYEGIDPTMPRKPAIKGRVVTTLHKAKEVRPLVERCITIARKSLKSEDEAVQYETSAERGTDEYREWRKSDRWQQWAAARAPAVAARRRALQLLGDKRAVAILFETIAPRFADRDGGYTRVLKLSTVRLGDAGKQAIVEFVGKNDRVKQKSEKPAFDEPDADELVADEDETAVESSAEGAAVESDEKTAAE